MLFRSYGNANVAAYLPIYNGPMPNLSSINTSGNITANAGGYFIGDGSLLTNLPIQAGTYSNTNVAAYLTTASIDTTGNITAANLISNNFLYPNGVSILTGIGGTYSNTNVTALLSSNTISTAITTTGNIETTANVNAQQLHSTDGVFAQGNVTAPYYIGDGSQLTNVVTQIIAGANVTISPASGKGIVTISANGSGGGSGTSSTGYYLNAYDTTTQTAASATTAYVINIGNVASANGMTITSGNQVYFTFAGVYQLNLSLQLVNHDNALHNANVWVRQNGTDLTWTNSNQTLLQRKTTTEPSGTILTIPYIVNASAGDTVQFVWQTDGPGSGGVEILTEAAGTSPTRPGVPSVILTAQSVANIVGLYGDSNVATFLSTGFGSNTITTTGNITAGNLIATSYVQGDGSKLTNLPVQAGTYSNANVAAYLPGYNGSIGSSGSVMNNINMGGTLTIAANIPSGTTSLTSSAITTGGTGTFGNVISTSGYFWANGAAYNGFTGNLLGSTLNDSTNLRVLVNASPYSAPNTSTGLTSNYVNATPVYTSGVLQSPTLNTTVGAVVSSKIGRAHV